MFLILLTLRIVKIELLWSKTLPRRQRITQCNASDHIFLRTPSELFSQLGYNIMICF